MATLPILEELGHPKMPVETQHLFLLPRKLILLTMLLASSLRGPLEILQRPVIARSTCTINDFSFNPLGGGATPLFTVGGFSFTLKNIQIVFQDALFPQFLVLSGTGIGNLSGFDPTPLSFGFTGNQFGQTLSFSGCVATPEPGTMVLMVSGLVGLGFWRKLKK